MERKAWPYVAALVDGEGTISSGVHTLPDGKVRSVRLHIHVNNSDRRIIKWLMNNFGGAFYQDSVVDGYSTPDSTRYKWYIGAQAIQKEFLNGIYPFLVLKKKQADAALQFFDANMNTRLGIAKTLEDLNNCFAEDRIFPEFVGKTKAMYTAGIMDGEGSFCICRCGAHGEICWRSDVSAGNTDFQLIKWLLANYGGRFYSRLNRDSDKPLHSWRLSGRANKERFILQVLPYLEIKRESANTVLQFLRLGSQPNPVERKRLAEQCSRLNNHIESPETNTQGNS